jgi:hypothetical protein
MLPSAVTVSADVIGVAGSFSVYASAPGSIPAKTGTRPRAVSGEFCRRWRRS